MDGAFSRLTNVWVLVPLLVAALVLSLGAAAAQPAGAQDDAPDDAGADDRLAVADFPGQIGTIVQNLLGQKVPTRRYRGEQRFDTARLIALDAFDDPSDVVIARGDLFPDALSGSYLAGQLEAPLLLTSSHRLEPDTLEALADLDPHMVTAVGGTAAIAPEVAASLLRQGYRFDRVDGFDRFETAALAATAEGATVGERDGHGRTAIVARADEFADALVAGTLSYTGEFPLLLTRGDRLHADTSDALDELAIDHVIVPGGSAAVGDDVVDEIADRGIDVERVSGVDRVATSVEFAQFMREEFGFGLDRVNAAIGTRFADALALGPLSGPFGQPIVLTAGQDSLGGDGAVQDFLSQTCVIDLAGIGGGHAAISPDLEERIRDIATSTGAPCILDLVPNLATRDLGADHTLTGTLTDNAREPVEGEDVRTEVYRATDLDIPLDLDLLDELDGLDLSGLQDDLAGLPLDELLGELEVVLGELGLEDLTFGAEPIHTFVETTDADGEVTNTYTGPELPAVDVAIACLEDGSEECALLGVGDVLEPAGIELDPDQVSDSGVVLWGIDLLGLLPDLLLVEPPLAVEDSGGTHEVTATVLRTDLTDLPSGLDPGDLLDVGDLTELSGLEDLLGLGDLDPDELGERVGDTDVLFEVYRVGDLLALEDLLGLESLLGILDDPAALLDLLAGTAADGDLLDALGTAAVASGVETTNSQGEATFTYDGPEAGALGLDLIVACFDDEHQDCFSFITGLPDLPDELGFGVGAALWAPGDLAGIVEELLALGELELLEGLLDAGLLDELLESGALDEELLEDLLDAGLLDDLLTEDLVADLIDAGLLDAELLAQLYEDGLIDADLLESLYHDGVIDEDLLTELDGLVDDDLGDLLGLGSLSEPAGDEDVDGEAA